MRIAITQVYIRPGVKFPFSYLFQRKLSDELAALVRAPRNFATKYGRGTHLTFYMSAKRGTAEPTIKGPAIYKRTKDVEFTIFLPFDDVQRRRNKCRCALEHLLAAIETVLRELGCNTRRVATESSRIIDEICSDRTMLEAPWPRAQRRRSKGHG